MTARGADGGGRRRSEGKWILAEGADASGMTRSVPMEKIMKDAMLALYQNGERVRPSNGYPMRLFLPGFEGNMNVKHLRRIKVLEEPTMSRDETSKYTMTRPGGKSTQFNMVMEAKSMITHPSPDLKLKEPGLYQLSGLAWSGYGISRQGRSLRRRRQELGGSGAAAAGAQPRAGALQHAVALGRRAGAAAEPRHRRHRLRAADARQDDGATWALGQLSRQLHHDLERAADRRGETCLRVSISIFAVRSGAGFSAAAGRRRARTSDAWPRPRRSRPMTSMRRRTAQSCRREAARRSKAKRSMPRNAWAVMARRAKAARSCSSSAAQGTIGVEKKPLKTVGSFWPYATSVFAYTRRSMPFYNSKSLTQ